LAPTVRILLATAELTGDSDRPIVSFLHHPVPGHDGQTNGFGGRRPGRRCVGAFVGFAGRRLRVTWRLATAQPITLRSIFWRMLPPRWSFDPLSGAGAARAGGRWNAPCQAAPYLSETQTTVMAEYQPNLPRPRTLTAYEIGAASVLDLTDGGTVTALGFKMALLQLPWQQVRDVQKIPPSRGISPRKLMPPGSTACAFRHPGQREPIWCYGAGTSWAAPGCVTSIHLATCHAIRHPGRARCGPYRTRAMRGRAMISL
jgi:RES domain-containing protein